MAEQRLAEFEAEWGKKYPAIGLAWWRAWNAVVPFFTYPPEVRRMIYTRMRSTSPFCCAICYQRAQKPASGIAQDYQDPGCIPE